MAVHAVLRVLRVSTSTRRIRWFHAAARRRFAVAWASLLVAWAQAAPPSDFLITNWRTEDGLPHSSVNSIVQTRDGYLWIGTFVGVVRFDGVRFVHYSTANMPQLGPGRVSRLFEDRDGVLWIGLESGRLLARKNGEVRIHLPNSNPPNEAIIAMVQDQSGTTWLQTSGGRLGRLTSDSVEFVATTGALSHRPSLGLAVDDEGILWVGTKEGLKVWTNGALVTPPGLEDAAGEPVDAFARAREGGVWVFGDRRLRKFRAGKMILEVASVPEFVGPAVELLETSDGRLWLAVGDGGLFCLQRAGGWQSITAELGLRGGNKTLCEDREGNVWRGGFGGGLTRLRRKSFEVHQLPFTELDRYAESVCADTGGNVWALLNAQSLARIDATTHSLQLWQPPVLPQGFRVLFSDRAGTLWLGTGDGRVFRKHDGAFVEEFRANREPDFVSAFFEDSKSNLWVGFTGGAGVGIMPNRDPKKWRVVEGLSAPDVRAIAEAPDGSMWFGTHYGGVFRLKEGRWTRFTTRDGLPSDYVRCLLADDDGTIWLGTMYGLARWRDESFTAITTEHGLWHNSLSHIADDGRGNLWLSSFGGVFRVSRQELNEFAAGKRASIQCIGYNRNDGLPAQECPGGFQPAGAKTPDGRLWFPTVDGLVSLDPHQVTENERPPPVVMEALLVDGVPANLEVSGNVGEWVSGRKASPTMASHPPADSPTHSPPPSSWTGLLHIAPGRHRIEFQFTALSFTAPEKVRFRHKLEGLDPDWSEPEAHRTVTYNFVPPGSYTFQVTACNNDGIWNPEGASLALVVRPFFWQTWWFNSVAAGVLAIALILSVRQVERRKVRLRLERLERQHALERERSRIAKDIHDDLGASLTQISFLSERVESSQHDPLEVERWNKRIAGAARRTIQSLDEIVWAVSPKHDTLESLANYLSRFAQDHLELAGVRCVLDVLTVLPPLALSAEVRHNLLLAAREALQNVVAHSGATEVRVALDLRDDVLEISISDNGRGFDRKRASVEGNGLNNMRKRLEEIGGEFEPVTGAGEGTSVKFRVPRARLHVRGIGDSGNVD